MTVVLIPPKQGVDGKAAVSFESQGAPLPPMVRSASARQRWQMPGYEPVLLRSVGSPASIRKPFILGVNQVSGGSNNENSLEVELLCSNFCR
jgi:hypothetical protein